MLRLDRQFEGQYSTQSCWYGIARGVHQVVVRVFFLLSINQNDNINLK